VTEDGVVEIGLQYHGISLGINENDLVDNGFCGKSVDNVFLSISQKDPLIPERKLRPSTESGLLLRPGHDGTHPAR
jgi:hypothetical protein